MTLEVSSREFFRNPYKYIGKCPIVITNRGSARFYLSEYTDGIAIEQKMTHREAALIFSYGCGCERQDTKVCPKHGRS